METKGQDVRTCPPQAPITHHHAIWGTRLYSPLALLGPFFTQRTPRSRSQSDR